MLNPTIETTTVDRIVHPGAALFSGTRIKIEIKLADQLSVSVADFKKTNAWMPNRRTCRLDLHPVDRLDDAKQPVQYAIFGEILAHFLFRERIASGFQLFGDIREIPRCDL